LTTYTWAILAAAFVVAPVTAAAAAPPTQQVVDEFVIHKTRGDTARRYKRLSEALVHYESALAIRYDPVVAGWTGVFLSKVGDFVTAAHRLHRVLNDTSASLSRQDRLDFSQAYSDVLLKVCRVDIHLDRVGARVEIDRIERSRGRADFWVFMTPGDHVIRAHLQGFLDTIEGFVTEPGRPHSVTLAMQSMPVDSPPPFVTMTVLDELRVAGLNEPLYDAKLPPNRDETSTNGRFVFGIGPWISFGAVPGVGLGGQLHGGWRSRSWWELGLEVRGAVTLGSGDIHAGSAYILTVTAAPCGRFGEHVFGCVLAQVEKGGSAFVDLSSSLSFGLRTGYEFHVNDRFSVALFGDLAFRPSLAALGLVTRPFSAGNWLFPVVGLNALTFF
jgi:hypothetical protein